MVLLSLTHREHGPGASGTVAMPLVAQICANVNQFVGGVCIATSTGVHADRLKTVNKSASRLAGFAQLWWNDVGRRGTVQKMGVLNADRVIGSKCGQPAHVRTNC